MGPKERVQINIDLPQWIPHSQLYVSSQIIEDKNFTDSWRQLGVEMLVTLAENAPAMVRKLPQYIPHISKYF